MALRWSGRGPTLVVQDDELAALQTGHYGASKDGPCVVREDILRNGLKRAGLRIVWGLVGERSCWDGSAFIGDKLVQFSGVYTFDRVGIRGGLTKHVIQQCHS